MKQKPNWELLILILIYASSLRMLIWKNLDPTTFSDSEQEKIGLTEVDTIKRNKLKKNWL